MVRIGIIGTSEWTERIYVRTLQDHPHATLTAVSARHPERTPAFAAKWDIPHVYTDWRAMLDSGHIDAVIISAPNHLHHPIAMHAAANDLHIFCEKPLAMTYAEADAIAAAAESRGLVGMTAFTYWYFPHYRYISQLVAENYVGTPYHLNLRYLSGFGMDGSPLWRFDMRTGGPGALGDLGSHAFSLARAFLGDITAVSASLHTKVTRADIPAEHRAPDHAIVTVQFANGASGVLDISMASYQPRSGGQKQALELSGTDGTLYYTNDFSTVFSLTGAKVGDEAAQPLDVPPDLWPETVSRENPRTMYPDLFQKTNVMAREFVSAIHEGRAPNGPDLREGANVQRVQDAAVLSASQNSQWVDVKSIRA